VDQTKRDLDTASLEISTVQTNAGVQSQGAGMLRLKYLHTKARDYYSSTCCLAHARLKQVKQHDLPAKTVYTATASRQTLTSLHLRSVANVICAPADHCKPGEGFRLEDVSSGTPKQ
jgi:hypothetical protein